MNRFFQLRQIFTAFLKPFQRFLKTGRTIGKQVNLIGSTLRKKSFSFAQRHFPFIGIYIKMCIINACLTLIKYKYLYTCHITFITIYTIGTCRQIRQGNAVVRHTQTGIKFIDTARSKQHRHK